MARRAPTPAQIRWWQSARFKMIGRDALRQVNAGRHNLPTCGAKTRTTGEPCRNLAGDSGRCRLHGQATPRGDEWHVRQWPNRSHPKALEKAEAKIRDRERVERKRKQRLAGLTDEERAAHERWQKSHRPGSAAERARKRSDRKAAAEVRALMERPAASPNPEREERRRLIEFAKRKAAQEATSEPTEPQLQGAFA